MQNVLPAGSSRRKPWHNRKNDRNGSHTFNNRTYAVGAATTLTTGTMQPTPWFGTLELSDFGVSIGGDPHDVATVSYHTSTLSSGRTFSLAVADATPGLAHAVHLDRLERDGLDLAHGAANADTRGAPSARSRPRCAQSCGADYALVD